MKVKLAIVLVASFGISDDSFATESCDAILSNGINNIAVSKGADAAAATKYFNYCEKNLDSMSDEMVAQAEVEVIGYGSGEGNFERNTSATKIKDWCKTNKDYAESHKSLYNESRTISDSAVAAWVKCKEASKSTDVTITPVINAALSEVIISLKYNGVATSGVRLSTVKGENFSCNTEDPEKPAEGEYTYIKKEVVAINCTRAAPDKDYVVDGQSYEHWPSGSIQFIAGEYPLSLDFAEIYTPPLPATAAKLLADELVEQGLQLPPIGAVVPFFISFDNVADLAPVWLPADGRMVEDQASPLYGTQLPDLSNRFVMGADPAVDVLMSGEATTGGNAEINASIHIEGTTSNESIRHISGKADNRGGPFAVDTSAVEVQRGIHTHKFSADGILVAPILPPFRKLIYLIRVR